MLRYGWVLGVIFSFTLSASVALGQTVEEAAAWNAALWLESVQNLDGSWGSEAEIRMLETSEVVIALRAYGDRSAAYYGGVTWLENHGADNADDRARRILALFEHGDDVSADILRLGNAQRDVAPSNGGWGIGLEYDGSVLDTALVLEAFAAQGLTSGRETALVFLKSMQSTAPEFGWSLIAGEPIRPWVSAQVLRTLIAYESEDPNLTAIIASAVNGLASQVGLGDPALWRAHAARVLLQLDPSSPVADGWLGSLIAELDPDNGSWGNNVQVTAGILRALGSKLGTDSAAFSIFININDAGLRGVINLELGRNRMDALRLVDIGGLINLGAAGEGIQDLTGLELAVNLDTIDLRNNQITDLTPLVGLNPTTVLLAGNPLSFSMDADGDGFSDGLELLEGSDPLDPSSFPDPGEPIPVPLFPYQSNLETQP